MWAELDWRKTRKDGGRHLMNPQGGEYLHVRCKPSKAMDGGGYIPAYDRRWYRVRCAHEIGSKWRNGIVADVRLELSAHGWEWVITVSENVTTLAPAPKSP